MLGELVGDKGSSIMATILSWWNNFKKHGYQCEKYSDEEVVVFLQAIDNKTVVFSNGFVAKMRIQATLRGLEPGFGEGMQTELG